MTRSEEQDGIRVPAHEPLLILEGGPAGPLGRAAARPAPYTQLGRAVPQVSNLLYRRFPNRQAVQGSNAPACGAASGFGNPRYGRLGSLRYEKNASSPPLYLKTIDACKVQGKTPLLDEATCRLGQKRGLVRALQKRLLRDAVSGPGSPQRRFTGAMRAKFSGRSSHEPPLFTRFMAPMCIQFWRSKRPVNLDQVQGFKARNFGWANSHPGLLPRGGERFGRLWCLRQFQWWSAQRFIGRENHRQPHRMTTIPVVERREGNDKCGKRQFAATSAGGPVLQKGNDSSDRMG
jgi:hypothetical protein